MLYAFCILGFFPPLSLFEEKVVVLFLSLALLLSVLEKSSTRVRSGANA